MAIKLQDIARQVFRAIEADYAGMPECDDGLSGRWSTLVDNAARSKNLYDRQLFQYLTARIANLQDANLMFLTGPNCSYQPQGCGFDVRRYGDALYVTKVHGDARVSPGDAIIQINNGGLDAYVPFGLGDPMRGIDDERQDWSGALVGASHVTVRHPDGTTKQLKLRQLPAGRPAAPCSYTAYGDGTVVLRVTNLDSDEAGNLLAAHASQVSCSPRLVIDLRGCSGGSEASTYAFCNYVFDEATNLNVVQEPEVVLTNYSDANCARREAQISQLKALSAMQPSGTPEADLSWMDENLEIVRANRGKGYVEETVSADDLALSAAPQGQRLVVLIDENTADAAEWFVRLAKKSPRTTVIGRATRGNLDYSNPLAMTFEDRFIFIYPMSKSKAVAEGNGIRNVGIQPDLYVPFTPEECTRDLIMEQALAL